MFVVCRTLILPPPCIPYFVPHYVPHLVLSHPYCAPHLFLILSPSCALYRPLFCPDLPQSAPCFSPYFIPHLFFIVFYFVPHSSRILCLNVSPIYPSFLLIIVRPLFCPHHRSIACPLRPQSAPCADCYVRVCVRIVCVWIMRV